ncbi:hypothetical protein BIW11_05523 [Tropilaelaps mercedesae]|uniref:Uncharacterized protein n=1 Tax=Tropilaelaps mercedesae TaxID=418985 RepID=A0A1V9Y209_9ACAR|nr:hypothetical protein BIW11_05523 [Tropilaelaps mercedesae]
MARACTKRNCIWTMVDYMLLLVIVSPLVSMYWCGMFFLVDYYVFPGDYIFSIWFTCLFGYGAVLACHVIHERLTQWAQLADALYNPLARLYSILLIIVIVFQWRGFWYILEFYLGPGYVSGGVCVALGLGLMAASGCSKSITGVVPFILIADDKTNYFIALSKFSHVSSRSTVLKLADHLYSVLYIHPSVIVIWRGIWHLQDFAIYPDDKLKSGIVTFGIGVFGAIICYIIQWPLNSCAKSLPKFPRFIIEQLWRACVVTIAIFYWRGSWVFWGIAFKDDFFTMWFITITAAFLLCILNCWSVATLRGVWVDDPLDSQEDSIHLDVHYCSEIVSSIQEKQLRRVRKMENEIYQPVVTVNGEATNGFVAGGDDSRCDEGSTQTGAFANGVRQNNLLMPPSTDSSLGSWSRAPESII